MPHTIKLTSKRQATFPVQLCRELGIQAGDELVLERQKIDDGYAWILIAKSQYPPTWFGRLKKYTPGKSHNMETIRKSIGSSLKSRT